MADGEPVADTEGDSECEPESVGDADAELDTLDEEETERERADVPLVDGVCDTERQPEPVRETETVALSTTDGETDAVAHGELVGDSVVVAVAGAEKDVDDEADDELVGADDTDACAEGETVPVDEKVLTADAVALTVVEAERGTVTVCSGLVRDIVIVGEPELDALVVVDVVGETEETALSVTLVEADGVPVVAGDTDAEAVVDDDPLSVPVAEPDLESDTDAVGEAEVTGEVLVDAERETRLERVPTDADGVLVTGAEGVCVPVVLMETLTVTVPEMVSDDEEEAHTESVAVALARIEPDRSALSVGCADADADSVGAAVAVEVPSGESVTDGGALPVCEPVAVPLFDADETPESVIETETVAELRDDALADADADRGADGDALAVEHGENEPVPVGDAEAEALSVAADDCEGVGLIEPVSLTVIDPVCTDVLVGVALAQPDVVTVPLADVDAVGEPDEHALAVVVAECVTVWGPEKVTVDDCEKELEPDDTPVPVADTVSEDRTEAVPELDGDGVSEPSTEAVVHPVAEEEADAVSDVASETAMVPELVAVCVADSTGVDESAPESLAAGVCDADWQPLALDDDDALTVAVGAPERVALALLLGSVDDDTEDDVETEPDALADAETERAGDSVPESVAATTLGVGGSLTAAVFDFTPEGVDEREAVVDTVAGAVGERVCAVEGDAVAELVDDAVSVGSPVDDADGTASVADGEAVAVDDTDVKPVKDTEAVLDAEPVAAPELDTVTAMLVGDTVIVPVGVDVTVDRPGEPLAVAQLVVVAELVALAERLMGALADALTPPVELVAAVAVPVAVADVEVVTVGEAAAEAVGGLLADTLEAADALVGAEAEALPDTTAIAEAEPVAP